MADQNTPPLRADVVIRIAELSDAEGITSVINAAFEPAEEFFVSGDRINREAVRDSLRTGDFLLAEREGVLVGCVYVERRAAFESSLGESVCRAYLGLLSVDPAMQHSGLGSQLMSVAEDHCRKFGAHYMDIKVVNLREELFGFYQRRGYEVRGTSPFPSDVETKLSCHFIEMTKALR